MRGIVVPLFIASLSWLGSQRELNKRAKSQAGRSKRFSQRAYQEAVVGAIDVPKQPSRCRV